MSKTNTLLKKIRYFILIIILLNGLLLINFKTEAQIVYTDIVPDTTLIGSSSSPFHYYYMDLNHDSIDDIRFAHCNFSSSWINAEVYCVHGNNQDEMVLTSSGYPPALNLGASIGPNSGTWTNTVSGSSNSALFLNASGTGGNWIGVTDKYVGLRIMIGSNYYYGWARLDVPANASSMTIKDFAIQTTENTSINAGDNGTVFLNDYDQLSGLEIFAYHKTLYIDNNQDFVNDFQLSIFNILGEEVYKGNFIYNTEINLNHLEQGIYLVSLASSNFSKTYKIYLE